MATEWDTLMQVGTDDPSDELFALPMRVLLWNDGIVVLDRLRQHIRMFDGAGNLQWTAGREGGGPQEFRNVTDFQVAPTGNLWTLDPGNARIAEIDAGGEFVRQISLTHLPIQATSFLVLDDRAVLAANSSLHSLIEISLEDARVLRTRPLKWSEPLNDSLNLSMSLGRVSASGNWTAAMRLGPGFNLFRGDSVQSHTFIEHIPFARKVSQRIREAGGDSARFGAVEVHGTGEAYMMLFGGRPFRKAHPSEPTNLIDLYDLDGTYVRSYRLPVDAVTFTSDGENFFVVQYDPYPSVLKLRPRGQQMIAIEAG